MITIKTHARAVGTREDPRLVFTGPIWDDWSDDIQFCVHGEKLRWTCDECADHFAKHRKHLPPAAS